MRYISRKGIVLCEIAGENVLVAAQHLRGEVPYVRTLNETGAFCWRQLEKGIDEEELCRSMKEEFEIDEDDDIAKDVHALLMHLKERNYIQEY